MGSKAELDEVDDLREPSLGFSRATAKDLNFSRIAKHALHDDAEVDRWIAERREHPRLHTELVALEDLDEWRIEEDTGNISHNSGRFFTITGVKARHRTKAMELKWDQPMIDQPEIGILGVLVKKINGVLHFCLQAKEEPGNIHSVQLSPTVQATYSNYTRVHGGNLPPFVSSFLDPPKERVLYAKLQTEDGGRFLFKSNRNMFIRLPDEDPDDLPDGYIWLTLRQIGSLIRRDNMVNACARSVFSILFSAEINTEQPRSLNDAASGHSLGDVVQWIDDMKAQNHIMQKRVGLKTLGDWGLDHDGYLCQKKNKFFKVVGIEVTSRSREVATWSQPILDNVGTGIIGLLLKRTGGHTSVLMQAKAEAGNRSIIQLAPTVQFTQENYTDNEALTPPFLFEEFRNPQGFIVVNESRQAEEGARFYKEEHVHRVLMLPEGLQLSVPPEFRWMSFDQIRYFLHFGEMVNSCCRSILACLL
jgi:oxidase EvaA